MAEQRGAEPVSAEAEIAAARATAAPSTGIAYEQQLQLHLDET